MRRGRAERTVGLRCGLTVGPNRDDTSQVSGEGRERPGSLLGLLVEPDESDARRVRAWVRQAGGSEWLRLERVRSVGAALDRLGRARRERPDVVLLALDGADPGATEEVARVRAADPLVPIVVLTSGGAGAPGEPEPEPEPHDGAPEHLAKATADGRALRRSVRHAIRRAQQEAALHATEARFQMLVDQLPAVVYANDAEYSRAIYVSSQIERLVGHPPERFLEDPAFGDALIHPEDRERVLDAVRDAAGGDGPLELEYRLVARDGSEVWVHDASSLVRGPAGEPLFWQGVLMDVSEQRCAEAAIRRLAAMVEGSLDAIVGLSPDGVITDWNDGAERTYGYVADDVVGRSIDLLVPADAEPEGTLRRRALAGERGTVERRVRLAKDGRRIPIGLTVSPVRAADGSIVGLVEVSRDITERVESDRRMQESESRFRSVFEGAMDVMLLSDDEGRFVDVNPAALVFFGLSRGELIGATIEDFAAGGPELGEAPSPFRPQGSTRGTFDLALAPGRRRTVELAAASILPGLRLSVLRDITERLEAEAALRESEEKFRSAVESYLEPFGVYVPVGDGSGAVVDFAVDYVNAAGRARPPFAGSDPVGRSLPELLGVGMDSPIFQGYLRVAETGEDWVADDLAIALPSYEGGARYFDIRASRLGDRVAASWRDVTERVQGARRLRQALAAVRQADAERRRLLDHLVRAQEEERRMIAADIHDDSIQKLAAVAMRLDLLEHRHPELKKDEQFQRLRESMQASMDRLRHLMFDLRPHTLDNLGLGAALQQYLSGWRDGEEPAWEVVDELRIQPSEQQRVILYRVAQEALSNVRRHAQAGRAVVSLRAEPDRFVVQVSDDGRGFNPLTVDLDRPGHLGLVSMRERVELAAGGLDILSQPGEGTTVAFWLPRHRRRSRSPGGSEETPPA